MVHLLRYLTNAGGRDPTPLLDGEWVICGFEFDIRTQTDIARVHHRFHVPGLRIPRHRIAEPPKVWLFIHAIRVSS
jgi:hypothetical protein